MSMNIHEAMEELKRCNTSFEAYDVINELYEKAKAVDEFFACYPIGALTPVLVELREFMAHQREPQPRRLGRLKEIRNSVASMRLRCPTCHYQRIKVDVLDALIAEEEAVPNRRKEANDNNPDQSMNP